MAMGGLWFEVSMSLRVSCPYCNHAFVLPEAPAAGKAVCPRCGEAVAIRTADEGPGDGKPPSAGQHSALSNQPAAASPSPRRRQLIRLLVLIGFVGIVIGTWVGVYFRWASRHRTTPPEPLAAAVIAPLQLRGLSYLPSNSNVIFAVQPGPLLAYAERTHQEPADVLSKGKVPGSVLTTLARAGIPLQEIDHVAGGVHVPDADLSQLRFAF